MFLQKIESAGNDIKGINCKEDMFEWAIREDIKITILNLLETAKLVESKNARFNIAEKIIILLTKRIGWKRHPDDNQGNFVFDFHGEGVLINKQNNAVNIIKNIISAELNEKFEDNMTSYRFQDNYERIFDKAWQEFSDKKGRLI